MKTSFLIAFACALISVACDPGESVLVENRLEEPITLSNRQGAFLTLGPGETESFSVLQGDPFGGWALAGEGGTVIGRVPVLTWQELDDGEFHIVIDERYLVEDERTGRPSADVTSSPEGLRQV